jgi:hypothetical protein
MLVPAYQTVMTHNSEDHMRVTEIDVHNEIKKYLKKVFRNNLIDSMPATNHY